MRSLYNGSGRMIRIKAPPRKGVEQHDEYGKEEQGIIQCPLCENVHFKKEWHASLAILRSHLKNKKTPITHVRRCPACSMIENHQFEGEVTIEDFPSQLEGELLNLVHNFVARAELYNPQHRLISLEPIVRGWRVTLTENQLADRLAKKIHEAFNAVEVSISLSKEPYEVNRAHVTYRLKSD